MSKFVAKFSNKIDESNRMLAPNTIQLQKDKQLWDVMKSGPEVGLSTPLVMAARAKWNSCLVNKGVSNVVVSAAMHQLWLFDL